MERFFGDSQFPFLHGFDWSGYLKMDWFYQEREKMKDGQSNIYYCFERDGNFRFIFILKK